VRKNAEFNGWSLEGARLPAASSLLQNGLRYGWEAVVFQSSNGREFFRKLLWRCPHLDPNELFSNFAALERPPHPRELCQIPEGICQQQSPHAGLYQIALPGLQQIGCDSCDKHK
jgi:hypothetical protein